MVTLSIRIVADCVALSCQVTRKLNRATTLEFITVSAIIFIHCYQLFFIIRHYLCNLILFSSLTVENESEMFRHPFSVVRNILFQHGNWSHN